MTTTIREENGKFIAVFEGRLDTPSSLQTQVDIKPLLDNADKEIVLDSMTFEKSTHTISYLYTLTGVLDDPLRVDSAKFHELLLMEVKNSTNLKLYKDAGYAFRYAYYSEKNNGTKLFEATFRESDYR